MESFSEVLTCKVCMEKYNDSSKKPLCIPCGHTFCAHCLKLIYKKPNIKCPLDKKVHIFNSFEDVPINFSIINALHEATENQDIIASFDKKCEKHPKESLKFYCATHQEVICQNCLLEGHLGADHQITSSEEILQFEILKTGASRCLAKVHEHIDHVTSFHDSIKMRAESTKENLKKTLLLLFQEIQNQAESLYSQADAVALEEKNKADAELEKLKALESKLGEMMSKIDQKSITSEDKEKIKQIMNEVVEYQNDLDPEKFEVEEQISVGNEFEKYLYVEPKYVPSEQYKQLLSQFLERGVISQPVYDIMLKVDRKNFVADPSQGPYQDMPRQIGWNTTISAPHMHAATLEKIHPYLVPGAKVIDLGTGSGYMAACFAELVGKQGKVYLVDHIQQIIDFALRNIKKGNNNLLREKRIVSILRDARKGIPDFAPYDVIHVGGAIEEIPKEMIDQLKPGGIIWAPVGPRIAQTITVLTKNENGTISKEEISDVRYGSLTSVEDQLDESDARAGSLQQFFSQYR